MREEFSRENIPLTVRRTVIPDDDTTLFVCSGMQDLKPRFEEKDGGVLGTVQSCIRTTDLDLVGDGSHLSSFEMIGNFSFGNNNYSKTVQLWHRIVVERLGISVSYVTFHPQRPDHGQLWESLGLTVKPDTGCLWTDGKVGGYCTEMFVGDLEIGNLVNPQAVSVDVGFGLERLLQVVQGVERVDKTSLFNYDYHPIVRDHERTVTLLWENGIEPGNKGRNYVCRRLIRRMLPYLTGNETFPFSEWVVQEQEGREKIFKRVRQLWRKHSDKGDDWWRGTTGILPDELIQFRNDNERR